VIVIAGVVLGRDRRGRWRADCKVDHAGDEQETSASLSMATNHPTARSSRSSVGLGFPGRGTASFVQFACCLATVSSLRFAFPLSDASLIFSDAQRQLRTLSKASPECSSYMTHCQSSSSSSSFFLSMLCNVLHSTSAAIQLFSWHFFMLSSADL
jgi:hypothetical protein